MLSYPSPRSCPPPVVPDDECGYLCQPSILSTLPSLLLSPSPRAQIPQERYQFVRKMAPYRPIMPIIFFPPPFSRPFPKASGQPVASGTFGDTYEATHNDSKVRIKSLRESPACSITIRIDFGGYPQGFRKRTALWKRLKHPNIVPFLGVTTKPPQLISDWMPNGNVMEYIQLHPDADRLSLLSDTAYGMEYLHSLEIVHGNLKPANILIDANDHACIADFGLSAIVRAANPTASGGGSLRWTAPELLEWEGGTSAKASDVYAFGMVALEVLAGVFPFANSPPTTVAVDVLSGKRPDRPNHPGITDELWDMIQRCWDQEPQRRPGISDVACHLRSITRRNRGDDLRDSKYEYSILFNGSETSLQSMKFRELDEPLGARKTTSGPCGLFRGMAFWKPNRKTVSARDYYDRPGIPSEKALF